MQGSPRVKDQYVGDYTDVVIGLYVRTCSLHTTSPTRQDAYPRSVRGN
jgi:hypothetical protein